MKKFFFYLILALSIAITFNIAWALDIDTDGNDAVDLNRGGTNGNTAAEARSNLGVEVSSGNLLGNTGGGTGNVPIVTSISGSSTDSQIPSAAAVYSAINATNACFDATERGTAPTSPVAGCVYVSTNAGSGADWTSRTVAGTTSYFIQYVNSTYQTWPASGGIEIDGTPAVLEAAPGHVQGWCAWADGTNWQPDDEISTTMLECSNGSAYISIKKIDGTLLLASDIDVLTSGTITAHVKAISITTAEGAHDGDANAATLSDSGESWPTDEYIGMTLYNITDGSSCTVTDNDGTTMTCTLTGGTDNDWDVDDVWAVAPGPQQSSAMIYINAATTILHPATAGYGACYYSDGDNVVTVDPQSASMVIYLDGASIGAGDEVDSPGDAGDFICIHNRSATYANTLGRSGTWTDGGSS